jgi:hypothetical protein
VHPANITGAPLVTAGSVIVGVGQYLAVNGAVTPSTTQEWIQFVVGLLIAVGGALMRLPLAR